MASTVRELVDKQAADRPDDVYALTPDRSDSIAFGELRTTCEAVSAALSRRGLRCGDTVSFLLPNGLQTIRLLLGAMYGGFRVNPVNLLSQAEQMRYVLHHSDCRLVFAAPEWCDRARDALQAIGHVAEVLPVEPGGTVDEVLRTLGSVVSDRSAERPRDLTPDSTGLLMYTSGTTGVPKGVMLSNASLVANAESIGREHRLTSKDRVLAVLPLYHINAFAVTMLAPLAHGGSVVVPPKFSSATFWNQAVGSGCTWINVVPTIVSYLLEGPTPPRADLRNIRFCRSASAALPPEHHLAFEAKFGIGIIETMGLTETVAPSFSNPIEPSERKVGSVGRASGGEARVIDASLQPVVDGTTGEIVIRGPHVMQGYYKNEAATQASFTPDGWLRTGDLGHRDADGFFFVTGRIKELIIKGGENIAPREIDEVLLRHPAVLEAASVGVPDRHYGQEILACVVLREVSSTSEDDLRAFCLEHLGRFKTPRVFRFVESLPRGPSGKVQRLKLVEVGEGKAA